MARPKKPVELIVHEGKTHLTRAQIRERREQELQAPADQVAPPGYLTKKQREKFAAIACRLVTLGIMSNLDCDALARYIQSEEKYLKYNRLVNSTLKGITSAKKAEEGILLLEKLENLRDRALKQCRSAASDLGLTISNRLIPTPDCSGMRGRTPDENPSRDAVCAGCAAYRLR